MSESAIGGESCLKSATVYSPLEPNQTRFLTIFPASSINDDIRSELMLVSFDDEAVATYEALSYTWGSEMFTHSIFICGSITLSWTDVQEIMFVFHNLACYGTKYNHIFNFLGSRNSRKSHLLRTIMIDFSHSQATDPRDKVFAYLSIAKDGDEIVPDYAASVQKAYIDVVKLYIKNDRNMDIICTHHRGYSVLNLPSWILDWSISRNSTQNWAIDIRNIGSPYRAGFTSQSTKRLWVLEDIENCIITESAGLPTLNVCGVSIGVISEITSSIDPAYLKDSLIREIRSWKLLDIESGQYLNRESNFRAFCRTLVTDRAAMRYMNLPQEYLGRLEHDLKGILLGLTIETYPTYLTVSLPRAAYSSRFAILSSGHMALVPNAS